MAAAMAFQWSLAALETLMAEDQMRGVGVSGGGVVNG